MIFRIIFGWRKIVFIWKLVSIFHLFHAMIAKLRMFVRCFLGFIKLVCSRFVLVRVFNWEKSNWIQVTTRSRELDNVICSRCCNQNRHIKSCSSGRVNYKPIALLPLFPYSDWLNRGFRGTATLDAHQWLIHEKVAKLLPEDRHRTFYETEFSTELLYGILYVFICPKKSVKVQIKLQNAVIAPKRVR